MILFITICASIVGIFAFLLIVSTICMGKPVLMSLQVLMGSLKYSKEVNDKIDLELGKVDAGFYHVVVEEHTICLYSKEKYPDLDAIARYSDKPELEIWIENKFYSYGNIYRLNGQSPRELQNKRPSIKLMKQIYQLEKTKGESTTKVKKEKSKTETVVLG